MKIINIVSFCASFAMCEPAFSQPANVYINILEQTHCDSSDKVGKLWFIALSGPNVDSVEINVFREPNVYTTFFHKNSVDTIIWVPPGYYQVSKSFWFNGSVDTTFFSDELYMQSCTGSGTGMSTPTDDDCSDYLAPLHLSVISDDGLRMIWDLWKDGDLYLTDTTVLAVDTTILVPDGTYALNMRKYHHGDEVFNSWTEGVEVLHCLSTGLNEEFISYTADYEIFDLTGQVVANGTTSDMRASIPMFGLPDGVYVTRFSRDGKFIFTRTAMLVR